MNARYNAVIVGQTGVGKSSLINYLYGKKIADSGVGKPVTKQGFHEIDFEINELPVRLFDSWGLEADQAETWMHDLEKELKERSVNESADKWFHSAFYCIQASGARIQDCDIKIIKKFIENNYKISVVLTKSDLISEEEENLLREELQKQINGISIIAVCNEGKKTRAGITEQFGKHEIEQQAFNDFFDSLILRLPLRCKSLMQNEIDNWTKEKLRDIKENLGIFGSGDENLEKNIKKSASELNKKLSELMGIETEKTFKMYGNFSAKLGYPRQFNNHSESEHTTFERTKSSSSGGLYDGAGFFESVGITLVAVVSILPVTAWVLYNQKDDTAESLRIYISNCKKELNKSTEKQIKDLTKMLESLKSRAIEQKLLN